MKTAYRVSAFAVAIGVVLQAAWIALGTFTLAHDTDNGKVIDKNYDGNFGLNMHGLFAILVALAAIVLFAVSFGAHLPEGTKWAGFVLLAVVVQWVLAFISFSVPAVGILHGVNAFVIAALAGMTGRRASAAAPVRQSSVA